MSAAVEYLKVEIQPEQRFKIQQTLAAPAPIKRPYSVIPHTADGRR